LKIENSLFPSTGLIDRHEISLGDAYGDTTLRTLLAAKNFQFFKIQDGGRPLFQILK